MRRLVSEGYVSEQTVGVEIVRYMITVAGKHALIWHEGLE